VADDHTDPVSPEERGGCFFQDPCCRPLEGKGKPVEKNTSHYNRISALFFLGVGLFFSLYGRTVEIGTWNEPGPGFMPFWCGIVLTAMAASLFVGSFKRKEWKTMPPFFPRADSWKRVLLGFLSMVGYLLLFNSLGFTFTTFLFIAFLLRTVFPQNWKRTLIVASTTAILSRVIFINLLHTQLPLGFLGL
jgi:putative tricarboxylic transport membrane protein